MNVPRPGRGFAAEVAALSDDEIEQIIDGHANTVVGLDFWIAELERRRSMAVLDQISQASGRTAVQLEQLAENALAQAAENRRLTKLTWALAVMTGALIVLGLVAAVAAVLAL